MMESFEVESIVWEYCIYKDVHMVCCIWNFAITPILPTLNISFFKIRIWANLGKTLHSTHYLIFHCVFSYPCLLICTSCCGSLSIMVSATDFISSLISSFHEDGMACGKNPLYLGKQHYYNQDYYLFSSVCQL